MVRLFEQAHYTWPEWAEYLSAEIGRASTEPDVADASQYYEHWLAAAEKLVVAKGITTPAELAERKRTLADAARPAHEHEH